MPGLATGGVDLEALEKAVRAVPREKLKFVSITHVPSNGGIVYDVTAAVAVIRGAAGLPEDGGPVVFVDACQVWMRCVLCLCPLMHDHAIFVSFAHT